MLFGFGCTTGQEIPCQDANREPPYRKLGVESFSYFTSMAPRWTLINPVCTQFKKKDVF